MAIRNPEAAEILSDPGWAPCLRERAVESAIAASHLEPEGRHILSFDLISDDNCYRSTEQMITSMVDPRDERFLLFLEEAGKVGRGELTIPERIDRVAAATRAFAEAVELEVPPAAASNWAIHLAGWAISPDPWSLRPWAVEALHQLRRDPVRARNVANGVVDWVLGQVRSRASELRTSWQAVHDVGLGYPIDPDARLLEPAAGSAEVAVWSYALLRAIVVRHHRGVRPRSTTLSWAARAGRGSA